MIFIGKWGRGAPGCGAYCTGHCPSAQRALNNPDVTKPKFARIDYQCTPFDAEPMTPYKWPTQPWFAETGDFHGEGPLMIFCKGNVSSLKQFLRENGTGKK